MPFNFSPLSISTPQLACADQKSNQLASFYGLWYRTTWNAPHLSITEIKYLPLMTYSSSLFLPSHSYFLFFVFFRLPQNQRHDTKDNSHAIPWMFKLIYIFEHPRYAIAVKAALAALKSLQAVVRLLLTPCKNRNGFWEPPSPQKQPHFQ